MKKKPFEISGRFVTSMNPALWFAVSLVQDFPLPGLVLVNLGLITPDGQTTQAFASWMTTS